eukprot:CAMPEP_0176348292 /NCGR_PEP_ID=MMETSP0126-20121128/7744_1 /TAXON_ID=141414 ORGANISM="Strombidinopsis acuminatum, Strain SPMC142" /NCGR_SAMPLE_ID=MMETSP0126 /ASSEMBLY_ACC=CAM_ASM_000229 /LENGTH=119 /DNA_ID=CAMNT_0017696987 /DNA_START=595 /DNA_END=954 /DNA_ORIENTATION=-
MCFTDFSGTVETINFIGYSLNGVLALAIGINLSLIAGGAIIKKVHKCKLNRIRKRNLKLYQARKERPAKLVGESLSTPANAAQKVLFKPTKLATIAETVKENSVEIELAALEELKDSTN